MTCLACFSHSVQQMRCKMKNMAFHRNFFVGECSATRILPKTRHCKITVKQHFRRMCKMVSIS